MKIGDREIGPDQPPCFVADIGANHDGSLPRALTLATLAAKSGADFVKYQSFEAKTIVSAQGFVELGGQIAHQAKWDKSVYETYVDAVLPSEWLPVLAQHCRDLGVGFMSTAYSLDIVDVVDPYVDAHKIGSGDITYLDLIRYVASKGKPVLLATGASVEADVDRAVGAVLDGTHPSEEAQLVLMQCNSDYAGSTNAISHLNLRAMQRWLEYFGYCRYVGLSDHTPGYVGASAAVALGACVIEKHFTDDRTRKGPDHAFAMTPMAWRRMVEAARETHSALGDGIKRIEENEREAAIVQRRALRWACQLPKGHEIQPGHIYPTRPCPEGALEPYRLDEVVNRVLCRDVVADTLVRPKDFG